MGLIALNIASLNVRRLRNPSNCARLLSELSYLSVEVAAVQETHFIFAADCRVQENDYIVLSAYGSRSSVGVSLLIGRSLNADVNLVLADIEFGVVAVYAPNIVADRVSFYHRLAPFLSDTKRLVLVDNWNTILDPKIDWVGVRGSGRCESSLIDFMARHDLVYRFRLDHPGREMWTWLDRSPSVWSKS